MRADVELEGIVSAEGLGERLVGIVSALLYDPGSDAAVAPQADGILQSRLGFSLVLYEEDLILLSNLAGGGDHALGIPRGVPLGIPVRSQIQVCAGDLERRQRWRQYPHTRVALCTLLLLSSEYVSVVPAASCC